MPVLKAGPVAPPPENYSVHTCPLTTSPMTWETPVCPVGPYRPAVSSAFPLAILSAILQRLCQKSSLVRIHCSFIFNAVYCTCVHGRSITGTCVHGRSLTMTDPPAAMSSNNAVPHCSWAQMKQCHLPYENLLPICLHHCHCIFKDIGDHSLVCQPLAYYYILTSLTSSCKQPKF